VDLSNEDEACGCESDRLEVARYGEPQALTNRRRPDTCKKFQGVGGGNKVRYFNETERIGFYHH
jgi:hypothetical protein